MLLSTALKRLKNAGYWVVETRKYHEDQGEYLARKAGYPEIEFSANLKTKKINGLSSGLTHFTTLKSALAYGEKRARGPQYRY